MSATYCRIRHRTSSLWKCATPPLKLQPPSINPHEFPKNIPKKHPFYNILYPTGKIAFDCQPFWKNDFDPVENQQGKSSQAHWKNHVTLLESFIP